MKKLKYLFFIILLIFSNVLLVKADSKSDANSLNSIIADAIQNTEWEATSKDNSMTVKIPLDSDAKKLFDNLNSSKVYLYSCSSKDNCTDKNWESNYSAEIWFNLEKEDKSVYLLASGINSYTLDSFKTSSTIYYDIVTKDKGWYGLGKKSYEKTGSYANNNNKVDSSGNLIGTIANPRTIYTSATFTVPQKSADFWKSSQCYWIKFDYSSKSSSSYARYKITSNEDEISEHTLTRRIFYASDAVYTLANNIIEDSEIDGAYGISNENKYAICDSEGVKFTFSYYDDKTLKLPETNNPIQQQAELQNGKDSYEAVSDEEIAEARAAINGTWNPNTLCANNSCNIDITKFCTDPYVARTLKFLGLLLAIAKVIVPALIIGLGFVDLAKIVISGKVDEAKKQGINIIKRVVIGIVIFLIPTILITIYNVAYSIANDSEEVTEGELNVPTNFKNCVGCILDANNKDACIVNTN